MTWLTLLLAFLQIGFFSIGGGYATIPLIQEQVVDNYHWLSMQEFTDIITISQMTPGPLAVNTSTFTGIRILGIPGAVLATFGCVISGFVICLCLYCFFSKYRSAGPVFTVLRGLRAASIGLIAASAGTILAMALAGSTVLGGFQIPVNLIAVALFLLSLLLLRKFRLNPILVMAVSGAAGAVIYFIPW